MRAADNPFRSERVASLGYRLSGVSWGELRERLDALGCRAAIVGPQGSGKTTLLEELSRHLASRQLQPALVRLASDARQLDQPCRARIERADSSTVVLLDGAEQLSYPTWLWLSRQARRAAGLIITTHRPGRLPTLYRCRTSVELAAELVEELLPPSWPRPSPASLDRVFGGAAGNLRDVLGEYYDAAARACSPQEVVWP